MIQPVLILLIGSFSGILTGLMGASGVMAVVPGMVLLGYSVHQAIGASLAVDMLASVVVAGTYYKNGNVALRDGILMALAAAVGALAGSSFSSFVPEFELGGGFGILLIVMAALLWKNGPQGKIPILQENRISRWIQSYPVLSRLIIGLTGGISCGLFGAGGGTYFLLALLLLGLSVHQAVGTSTMVMALTTASGAIAHAAILPLPYLTVAGIGCGTLAGSYASARLANRLEEQRLVRVIAIVFAALGAAILIKGFV